MARDIGTEYDITDTVQDITIPIGDGGDGCTLINDGTDSIFWREVDQSLTPTGNAAALVITPFFCSRLKQGEYVYKAGITLQVVCATTEASTLRVVPAKLGSSLLVEAEINVGVNLGLLNKAEAEIDPATEDKQDDIITQNTNFNAVLGTTTDDVLAGETLEDNTPRTGISLWKRAVNKLIDIKALLTGTAADTARSTATLVIPVQTIDAAGNLPVYTSQTTADVATGSIIDEAPAVGDAGSLSAKQRLMTTQLDYIGDNIDQVHVEVNNLDATASWAASTDASGITQETTHVPDHSLANSLSFDKAAGTVVEASYGKLITAVDGSVLAGDALVTWFVKHINFTNVETVFVRLGTDSSNYNQYGIDPVDFSATLWNHITIPMHEGVQTGTGLNLSAIAYVAFGVIMDASANTITEIFFNDIELHSINVSELQSGDVTANTVRVTKVGSAAGGLWPKGAGALTDATPRMTLASDDPAVASLGIMDDWDESDRAKVNLIAGQIGVAANSGNKDALTQRVAIATDDINQAAINVATGNRDEVLSGRMWRVDVTNTSATIATKISGNLDANTTSIMIVPEDDTLTFTMNHGASASGTTPRVPATGVMIPVTNTVGDAIHLWIAAGTEQIGIFEYVQR